MSAKFIFFLILGIDALILFFQTSNVSISYDEAKLLYGTPSFLQILTTLSLKLFGHNDFSLRLGMITLHLLSATLMYTISKQYISSDRNRIWLLLVFILLPGVVSSAIIVNDAGLIIFGLLFFIYLSQHIRQNYLLVVLFMYALTSNGFAYLFLGLGIYYFVENKRYLSLYLIALYVLTGYLYGFGIDGSPKGHFLDTIGVYSAIFTPIIFIYLFYALYRRYLVSKVDMLWYIASTALILSLVLSFRQRVEVEDFAPYLIVALPLAAQSFISSYRVRLKHFRKRYKLAFVVSFLFLLLNTVTVLFNKELYLVIEDPKQHFAYDMHIAKELSNELKSKGISCLETDRKMQERLRFYGIKKCSKVYLTQLPLNSKKYNTVTVSYKNKTLYSAYVTKLNNI